MINNEYKKIYDSMITAKSKSIIIEYSSYSQNYKYKPFSHFCKDTALDELFDLVIDNVVFYAFSENEIIKLKTNIEILNDLRSAAKFAFSERLPNRLNANSDGTLGEVLLDLLIQVYEPLSQKLLARAKHTEISYKSEITGYDALYFTKSNDEISLWLGQAKAGTESYCKSDIKNDLNSKFSSEYFSDTAFYIADKSDSKDLTILLNEINRICLEAQKNGFTKQEKTDNLYKLLRQYNIQIKIPCLLAYTKNVYDDMDLLPKEIEKITKSISKYYDLSIKQYIIFMLLRYSIIMYWIKSRKKLLIFLWDWITKEYWLAHPLRLGKHLY